MTLVNRLAERTGATVLYGWCERIGPDMEFALHIEPTDPAVADPAPQVAAPALHGGLARLARRAPAPLAPPAWLAGGRGWLGCLAGLAAMPGFACWLAWLAWLAGLAG
ncbi:hypothetical protein G6F58_013504 [Rhizopus delemar]|nr:hypothetical protein G6F58_013504 [Rhizopus delemar]